MKRVKRTTLVALFFGMLLIVGAGVAQPKTEKGGPENTPVPGQAQWHCPMRQLRQLADLAISRTREGASLSFSAKDPGKVLEVQALVEKLSQCAKGERGNACEGAECDGPRHMRRAGNKAN